MPSVRIAGIVGEKDSSSVKDIAAMMQVARWVRMMSEPAPGPSPAENAAPSLL